MSEEAKPVLSVVVCGHVDSGKSTILGHISELAGLVDSKTIRKYEREASLAGKKGFHYAWVMDGNAGERQRGMTAEMSLQFIDRPSRKLVFLDTPGHREYLESLLAGIVLADVGILVLSARPGENDAALAPLGRLREHVLLLKSLGVGTLVLAVNKMDIASSAAQAQARDIAEEFGTAAEWERDAFENTLRPVVEFCTAAGGYKPSDIYAVPISGLSGGNLVDTVSASVAPWWQATAGGKAGSEGGEGAGGDGAAGEMSVVFPAGYAQYAYRARGQSLFQLLDALSIPSRQTEGPMRYVVDDVYPVRANAGGVSGRVLSGVLAGGVVSLHPSVHPPAATATPTHKVKVASLSVEGATVSEAAAGVFAEIVFSESQEALEQKGLRVGSVLSIGPDMVPLPSSKGPPRSVPVVAVGTRLRVLASILISQSTPLTPNLLTEAVCGRTVSPAVVIAIHALVKRNKTSKQLEVSKEYPSALPPGTIGLVEV